MDKGNFTRPKLKLPHCPVENDDGVGIYYDVSTYEIKKISDYTKLNFNEVLELDYIDMLIFLRDAYIYNFHQSERGREYLESCWILEQTEPDRVKLREYAEKGGQDV